jgi:hypothetical protein
MNESPFENLVYGSHTLAAFSARAWVRSSIVISPRKIERFLRFVEQLAL